MAADWRMIELDAEEIAAGKLETIRAEFALFFLMRDPGAALAVFTRRAKSGACEVYFSPACVPYTEFIFERHHAETTRAPALLGTTLLVGYTSAVGNLLGKPKDISSFKQMLQQQLPAAQIAAGAMFLRAKPAG